MASTSQRASSQPPPNSKSVQFALKNPEPSSPEQPRRSRRDRRGYDSDSESSNDPHRSSRRDNHHRHRPPRQDSRTPSPAPSDQTVDLPPRFDEQGRPKRSRDEDPLVDTIGELLGGKGVVGKILLGLTDGLVGGNGGSSSSSGRRDERRRRRR